MGDIAICYKNCINLFEIQKNQSTIIIKIEEVVIIAIYWSPNELNEIIEKRIRDLQEYIMLDLKNEKIILIGDFNTRSVIYEKLNGISYNKRRAQAFEEFLMTSNLTVRNPYNFKTFENKNGSSVIDLIITNERIKNQVQNIKIKNESLSYHKSINFEITDICNFEHEKNKTWAVNYEKFERIIEVTDFDEIVEKIENSMDIKELDNQLIEFSEIIKSKRKECLVEITERKNETWWNDRLETQKKLIKKLTKLKYKYKRGKKNMYLESLIELMKILKSQYTQEIIENKNKIWKNLITESSVWGKPYKIIMEKYKKFEFPPIKLGNKIITEEKEKYKEIFLNIFPNINDPLKEYENEQGNNIEIDELLIKNIIKKLNNRKANGHDDISNKMLKIINKQSPEIFKTIFQKLLSMNYFPETWKLGKIKLLNKPNKNPAEINSYRPLTLLPTLGKVYEKIIKYYLNQEIEKLSIFHEQQYGFREGRSTETALIELTKTLDQFRKIFKHVILVSFDITGAFNWVKWSRLLETMEKKKINSQLIQIIQSYFENRKICFFDKDNNLKLEHALSSGVPQGSALSPTLFNIAMTEVHEAVKETKKFKLLSYADDLLIIVGINKMTDSQLINDKIEMIKLKLEYLGLTLNPNKTQMLFLSRRHKKYEFQKRMEGKIKLGQEKIIFHTEMKYLGIIIDQNLNYNKHVEYITNKLRKYYNKIRALYGNTFGMDTYKREILYNALFRSIIEYGSLAYFEKLRNTEIKKLKSLQRTVLIGIISAYRTVSHTASHVIAGITPIDLQLSQTNKIKTLKIKFKENKITKKEMVESIKTIRLDTIKNWQEQYEKEKTGRRTAKLIPDIGIRLENKKLKSNYFLTQYLTGHGNFATYLKNFNIINDSQCRECLNSDDDPDHTFIKCKNFDRIRGDAKITTEELGQCLQNGECHQKLDGYIRKILKTKKEIK